MLQFLPYAMAAYGGYRGYKDSKDQGISGINRLLNTATGAALGYNLGSYVPGVKAAGFGTTVPTFTQLPGIRAIPGFGAGVPNPMAPDMSMSQYGMSAEQLAKEKVKEEAGKRTMMEKLLMYQVEI